MRPSIQPDQRLISVVVPLYKEESNVRPLIVRLAEVFHRLGQPWEIVFALDPSPDRTREVILELIGEGFPIRLLTFSRRIGKPLSLIAGLDHIAGDACIIIDADLQDPPELIEVMLQKWNEGFQVVIAQRTSRKGESYLYLKAAQAFYRILEKISEVPVPRDTGDFRLLDARVVSEVCKFRERHGFLRGLTAAAGFRTATIPYERDPRHSGRTQISVLGAINIAFDGIVPFSRAPVRMLLVMGLGLVILGLVAGGLWLVSGMLWGFSNIWPIVLLFLFMTGMSGIMLSGMGILGEYLVRTYEEARERPLYIIDTIHEAADLSRPLSANPRTKENP
ncbi:MAG: glycosyltransferase family 2 protein [Desulfomonile tiedjei]|uniref:Glycosyltransferase family 2 protein n=1 Tax=Desulfomonile tiedjei TaxID=2358 RepID=A0A9D6Z3A5_9BACT|nr:glycosyltransferase family 2 protein [Desulfomonile tiedjei]